MSEMQMGLEKLVENLLHRYECVILPEFGGFIVRESPCNFSASGDKLKPYSKHIFFNPHLTLNDGLIYNEIQTQKACTYNEAISWYNQQIGNLKILITEAGSAKFGNLGSFFPGKENSFWFSPSSDLNLASSTYGLFPVEIHKVAHTVELADAEKTKVLEIGSKTKADRKPIESLEPARINYKAWLSAAAVALLVHFVYLKVETTDVTTNEASVLPTFPDKHKIEQVIETVDTAEIATIDTVQNTETVVPESPVAEEPTVVIEETPIEQTTVPETAPDVVEETPVIETPTVVEPTNESVVQYTKVAKYKMESNALYHKKDLEKKGEKVKIEFSNGLYEVYIEQ